MFSKFNGGTFGIKPMRCCGVYPCRMTIGLGVVLPNILTAWWFGTFFIFPYIGIILPQLTNIFQRGWNHQPVEDHPPLQKSLLNNQSNWMTEGSIMGILTDCQFHYDKSLSTTQKNEMTCRVQTPPEYREVHNERLQNEKIQYLLVLVN
jgi:hypothetical protein